MGVSNCSAERGGSRACDMLKLWQTVSGGALHRMSEAGEEIHTKKTRYVKFQPAATRVGQFLDTWWANLCEN